MSGLAELFPAGDYRHHLTLRRGEPRDFFRSCDATGHVLAERARWLAEEPARYAVLTAEGAPLLAEFSALCAEWGVAEGSTVGALGGALEPDFLLLSPDAAGAFRLRGGALCFPTGWALEEKLGHTLDFIHGIVPGLNAALAAPIGQFLARLKPGVGRMVCSIRSTARIRCSSILSGRCVCSHWRTSSVTLAWRRMIGRFRCSTDSGSTGTRQRCLASTTAKVGMRMTSVVGQRTKPFSTSTMVITGARIHSKVTRRSARGRVGSRGRCLAFRNSWSS